MDDCSLVSRASAVLLTITTISRDPNGLCAYFDFFLFIKIYFGSIEKINNINKKKSVFVNHSPGMFESFKKPETYPDRSHE